ncbi:MAG TPA: AAA family ATPase [Planctomycetota bacterium]
MVDELRLTFAECRDELRRRLAEPAPGRIQIVTGPRQVGKTTLLLELAAAARDRAVYAPLDGPEAAVPGHFAQLWSTAAQRAAASGPALLLLDEVQHLNDWAAQLKSHHDRLRRLGARVHVVASGSSALRLARGSRESLAGRFERLTLAHWPASALVAEFGLSAKAAVQQLVAGGAYPGAVKLRKDAARWSAYVRDAIVDPAIGRDLLALAAVRRPALLRQVFSLAASSPAQIVSLQKLQGQLQDRGALDTIAQYLRLLEEAFLVAPLDKHSDRPLRRRAAPPKLVVLSNALCAVVDARGAPDPERERDRHAVWVENACLAHAWNRGQRVAYWREEPFAIAGVVDGSWGKLALDVKIGRFALTDLRGLGEFTRRFPSFRPLLLCDPRDVDAASGRGIAAMSWSQFLLDGPATA